LTYFKLGWRLLYNNPLLNGAIIVQLAVSLMLFNFLIIHIQSPYIITNLLANLEGEQAVYIQPSPIYRFDKIIDQMQAIQSGIEKGGHVVDSKDRPSSPSLDEIVDGLPNVERVSPIYDYYISFSDISCTLRAYDEFLSDNVKLSLAKGKWFSDVSPEDGIVRVVTMASYGFNIGDILEWDVYDPRSTSGSIPLPVRIKITGLLNVPTYYLDFSSGGTPVYASTLFATASATGDAPLFFCSQQDMTEYKMLASEQANGLVFFKQGTSRKELNDNIAALAQNSVRADLLDDMIQEGYEIASKEAVSMLPVVIFIFLAGLAGLISLLALNTMLHRKIFAIYYICGCRWFDCLKITSIYVIYLIFTALLLYVIANNILKMSQILDAQMFTFGWYNVLTTGCILLLTCFTTLVIPYYILKHSSPRQILTEGGD
jgi:hypothetical protein